MRKLHLWGALLVGLSWGLALATVPAQAMTTVDQSAAALASTGAQRPLDDAQVHFVTVPSQYAQAAHPHGINTIASDQGSAITFTTKYLLPLPGYRHQAWGDPQSMAVVGHDLYVVYCPTAWHNRGRIVRFNMSKLASLKATPHQIQDVYTIAANLSAKEKQIRTAIKVGPAFVTGHGQSLAYNWRDHHLYMWCDRESAPRIPVNQYGYLQQMSATTLRPIHRLRFRLRHGDFAVPGGHVLAFDHHGRAYFWTRPASGGVYIYQGRFGRHHASFRLTNQVLTQGPGTCVQSMAFNPRNDRLYLVADDSIASLPVAKLAGRGSLTSQDVTWTHFASKREFEGLSFGADGQAYLLSNHQPEVLIGNSLNW
ncbi:hypothetical protein [Levilactobacillus sp. HBUAS70063]|uniref:hypothetical protein n=1 Tax=Levilactobacillus sp. HBUAS70063 TaxID=3109359 RepID=UPI00313334AF